MRWRNPGNNSKNATDGRAMAQAVSRRTLTTEARVRSRVSLCGIFGGQSGNGTGFSSSTLVFPCQFHSTGAPLQGKMKKLIIFITGLHNKPQGCGATATTTTNTTTITITTTNTTTTTTTTTNTCGRSEKCVKTLAVVDLAVDRVVLL
jgi:hypothetical protein